MVVRTGGEITNEYWWRNLSENSHLDYRTGKRKQKWIVGNYLREWIQVDGRNCIRLKPNGLTAVINIRLLVRYQEVADPSGRAVWGVGLRSLACWVRGFESRQGYGYLPCECCVLSGRSLCVGLITRPEEFNGVWCVGVWSCSLDNEEVLAH